MLQQAAAADALVDNNKRVHGAAAELWLGSLDWIVNDSSAGDVVLFCESNHNTAAASSTLLLTATNATTAVSCCSTSIAL